MVNTVLLWTLSTDRERMRKLRQQRAVQATRLRDVRTWYDGSVSVLHAGSRYLDTIRMVHGYLLPATE